MTDVWNYSNYPEIEPLTWALSHLVHHKSLPLAFHAYWKEQQPDKEEDIIAWAWRTHKGTIGTVDDFYFLLTGKHIHPWKHPLGCWIGPGPSSCRSQEENESWTWLHLFFGGSDETTVSEYKSKCVGFSPTLDMVHQALKTRPEVFRPLYMPLGG